MIVAARGIIIWPTVKKEQQQGREGSWQNNYCDGVLRRGWGVKQIAYTGCVWYVVVVTTTTCRQLGNDTTYDTEKKNLTSHDVADTSAVSGRRVSKTRRHVFKTNCGRHLKKRHFQLRRTLSGLYLVDPIDMEKSFNPSSQLRSYIDKIKQKEKDLLDQRQKAMSLISWT